MPGPELTIRPVAEEEIRTFAGWRHEPPYDVYDIPPPVDEAVEYFLRPSTGCHALLRDGRLAGFVTFGADARVPGGDYSEPGLDIGLGIKPELTGRGLGAAHVESVIAFAQDVFDLAPRRVTIASANERALRVWIGRGFKETQRFTSPETVMGSDEFVVLTDG
ncbi:MAG: GNAT family N-acetyltransferase [Acidimicrobiia bacterium]|nr:GNAT family N-acetyltransferase [Acidimicrobiia bacterium]